MQVLAVSCASNSYSGFCENVVDDRAWSISCRVYLLVERAIRIFVNAVSWTNMSSLKYIHQLKANERILQ